MKTIEERLVSLFVGVLALVGVTSFAFPSEGNAQSLASRVATLEAQMKVVRTAVIALTAQNATQAAQISALQTQTGTQATEITALQTQTGAQATQITALQGQAVIQATQIAALNAERVPVGTIITYSAETPPLGYLECDGTQVSRADYPQLFAVIGTAFGPGDGSSTFHLPDARGFFLRGWSHGTPLASRFDPERQFRLSLNAGGASGDHVGSVQDFAFQWHQHTFQSGALNPFGPFLNVAGGNSIGVNQAFTENAVPSGNGINVGVRFSWSETRPANLAVMYAIKY